MKKFFAVPLAVLLVAACSEPTASVNNNADLTPRYAKPGSGGGGGTSVAGTLLDATFNFDGDLGIASGADGANWGTDVPGGIGGSAASTVPASNGTSNRFLGRFQDVTTQALLVMPANVAKYSLTFDLYIIGSWDGRGKQAQNGVFQANVFSINYRCDGATGSGTPIFQTSFSNQKTVQQDYPQGYLLGGNKAATGSIAIDALGFRDDPSSNTPVFRSYGDVTYRLSYSGVNPCGAGHALTFVFRTSADPAQQSLYDESWGIDNVIVKAD